MPGALAILGGVISWAYHWGDAFPPSYRPQKYYSFPTLDYPQSTLVIGYSGFNSDDIEVAVERLGNAWTID